MMRRESPSHEGRERSEGNSKPPGIDEPIEKGGKPNEVGDK